MSKGEPSANGKKKLGPPIYAVVGSGFTVLPYEGVIEVLHKNGMVQGRQNLQIGPLFRAIADQFRDWSKSCEPGWAFQCPEARLCIIRLSVTAPCCGYMSPTAIAELEENVESKVDDGPGLIVES